MSGIFNKNKQRIWAQDRRQAGWLQRNRAIFVLTEIYVKGYGGRCHLMARFA